MKTPPTTSKVIAAVGPKNAAAVSTSAPMNAKVAAAAREAGVRAPSPKPAPSGRK